MYRRLCRWLLICYLASLITALLSCEEPGSFGPDATSDESTCELVEPRTDELQRDLCLLGEGIWNTSYPNVFNHTSYAQASKFLHDFAQLFEAKCSEHLSHFLCYATFPLCFPGKFHKVEPCQELCVAVRENCTPFLRSNGREWPKELDCNQFPQHGSKMCVWTCHTFPKDAAASLDSNKEAVTTSVSKKTLANCTGHLVRYPNSSNTQYGGIDKCDERCRGVYLTAEEQNFNGVWMAIWSLLCLLVSIITFLTWILNYKAIKSPEMLVYYIALSYFFIALSYTVSIALGEDGIICNSAIKNELNESALVVDGLQVPFCIIQFVVTYFFTLSSWMWWALLNLEWMIGSVKSHTIGIKWRICSHLLGWGMPIIFLLIALGTESVGGNPILRICWIKKYNEIAYLIGPLLAVIVFSCVVIMIAFSRVSKLQKVFKNADLDPEEVSRITTLIQVGLYCTIYLLPMGILLCCYWYEYWYRDQWEQSYIECLHNTATCLSQQKPIFNVIKTKFAVSLVMGILSGGWIFRKSSTRAWRKVCCICCSLKEPDTSSELPTVRHLQFTNERYAVRFSFSEASL